MKEQKRYCVNCDEDFTVNCNEPLCPKCGDELFHLVLEDESHI